MAPRRLAVVAVAVTGAVLVLAGCGSDGAPVQETVTGTPSPSVTVAAAPTLPATAQRHDVAGAEDTVRYWVAAADYSDRTGDTKAFLAVSAQSCVPCAKYADEIAAIYAAKGRVEGGERAIREVTYEDFFVQANPGLTISFDRAARSLIGGDGGTASSVPGALFQESSVRLSWTGGRGWSIANVTGALLEIDAV
jgi:hypothetical protein